ncbi:pilus assembly protein HofP|uniref:Pilus assembly protein HofP n=1 Tax=Brenneria salicis ATCC 15712 = DSM 30166 TaxID=714314 RepID=A0A366I1E3_9GAMM|nr:HofP DNA utilization family protein [Brenneria salicis]NMN90278.1 pilus assembly protein HofP [Brenneria salicis ATCC 15712 = DSM 30166]RBP61202.1 pilus assembly protein HofP [Brenneria salicis ATCC 15712 = DSM 30166]RLM30225.1 hypothetical protein BHG07_11715 [Brenneria salicis ATCC 15712 = DSM 30166]
MNSVNNGVLMLVSAAWFAFAAAQGNAADIPRDPFHPSSFVVCSPLNVTRQWQLKGVIGAGNHWVGWLAQSDAPWLKLKQGAVIPPGRWQVSQLDSAEMQLTAVTQAGACDGAPMTVSLASPFMNKHVAQ